MFSAERILTIRKSKGFSQELLAEQSGLSLRTIQRVEQGETVRRGHTMQALATALEVPLDALLAVPVPVAALAVAPTLPVSALAALAAAGCAVAARFVHCCQPAAARRPAAAAAAQPERAVPAGISFPQPAGAVSALA